MPWAADKAIQQLGRSHRAGQKSAPLYKLVVTELGGERRFLAAVAKRMMSLGALTKGDRRAASGSDLSEFDVDSVYGRRAYMRLHQCLSKDDQPTTLPSRNSLAILDKYILSADDKMARKQNVITQRNYALLIARQGLIAVGCVSNEPRPKAADIKMFLNRIAGLPVLQQQLLFALFMSALDDVISDAKATGEFEGSVEDLKATSIKLAGKPFLLAIDKRSGAGTELTRVVLDRGVSLDHLAKDDLKDALEKNEKNAPQHGHIAESGFYVSKRKIAGRHLVLFAARKSHSFDHSLHDPRGLMIITRPNTGKNPCEMTSKDLKMKYNIVLSLQQLASLDKKPVNHFIRTHHLHIAQLWDAAYQDSDTSDYQAGLAPRLTQLGLITGAVLHILPVLEKAVITMKQADRALRVVRVEITKTRERIVGIRFPIESEAVEKLRAILKSLDAARTGSADTALFCDSKFASIDKKSMAWATREPKNMCSFFGVSKQKSPRNDTRGISGKKRNGPPIIFPSCQTKLPKKEPIKNINHTKPRKVVQNTDIKAFFTKK